jgi:ATP-dependent DNA ligase
MLAVSSPPFDSPDYSFETKWDGVRALAAVTGSSWRLWGRELADYTSRYPELAVLRSLPAGSLVDGEMVALRGSIPNLGLLLRRHQLADGWKVRYACRWCPVRYVLFDLLYYQGRCLLPEPLLQRRELLAEVCRTLAAPDVLFSEGVVGTGRALFAAVVAQGHEGIMAKHQESAYRAGKRSLAWRKIKPAGVGARKVPGGAF